MTTEAPEKPLDFIREIIDDDLRAGKHAKIITRFPPEPNGYLHVGHTKAICLNFGVAAQYGGQCHLRFDDTNPLKEEREYIESIKRDIHWLGFDWGEHLYHASDYFEQLYEFAVELIKSGKAYVDDLSAEEIREHRGTLTEPGRDSPHRNRSVEENLEIFERMRAGDFEDGTRVLRAKIDMASPNINMRDPALFRIRKAVHPHRGDTWCIYPMYDFAHALSDAIEHITHSLCTLEFEDHRPLYDWCVDNVSAPSKPRQIEFARLNLTYTILSKRKLLRLVKEKFVNGWDDPRMPTIAGIRRRGYTPEAIRDFADRIGLSKKNSTIDVGQLEFCVRDHLNKVAPRRMGVLRPLKVVIENWPEGHVEELDAVNNPEDPSAGNRKVPFSGELWIERDDFMEDPPKKFFRLSPGREVRLRWAYFVTCTKVIKDDRGKIVEIRCTYDPTTRGGDAPDGRKVKATIHWVSAHHAIDAEIRLYDRLFATENPDDVEEGQDFTANLNSDSLETLESAKLEPSLRDAKVEDRFQFERLGYFVVDPDSSDEKLVFNRIVTLKDSWAKLQARQR